MGHGIPPTDLSVEECFYDRTLVDEADDVHFTRALGADKKSVSYTLVSLLDLQKSWMVPQLQI